MLEMSSELELADAGQREDLQEIRKMRDEVNSGQLFASLFLFTAVTKYRLRLPIFCLKS